MKRIIIAAAAAALLAGPLGAGAHEGHCVNPFILSGVDTGDARVGTNPGGVVCTLDDPDAHLDTNTTVPGSTHLWVGLFSSFPQPDGFVTIDGGDPIPLTFFHEEVRDRWESNSVSLEGVLPGAVIVATIDYGAGPESVTYTRV